MLFSLDVGGSEEIMDDATNRRLTNSLKFHVLTYACGPPS